MRSNRLTFFWVLGFVWAFLLLSSIGCVASDEGVVHDAQHPVHRTTIVEVCAEACDAAHCENVLHDAVTLEAEGRECEAECQWEQVACMHDVVEDYGGACGECEHGAAECQTACGWGFSQ